MNIGRAVCQDKIRRHQQLLTTKVVVCFGSNSVKMSGRKVVFTQLAPAPIGPYSQGVCANNTLYLSGQIGINPQTGKLVTDSIEKQVEQVFANLKAVVEAAGATLNNVVKVNIFILTFDHFSLVNEAMKQHFAEPYPARSTVAVASLPAGASVEIEAIVDVSAAAACCTKTCKL